MSFTYTCKPILTPYIQLPTAHHTYIYRLCMFWHPTHQLPTWCRTHLHFHLFGHPAHQLPVSYHTYIYELYIFWHPTSYDISYTYKFTPVPIPYTPISYATSCKHIQTIHILTPYTPTSYDISYTHINTPILTPYVPNAGNDTAARSCGRHLQLPFVTRPVFCVHICEWLTCVWRRQSLCCRCILSWCERCVLCAYIC